MIRHALLLLAFALVLSPGAIAQSEQRPPEHERQDAQSSQDANESAASNRVDGRQVEAGSSADEQQWRRKQEHLNTWLIVVAAVQAIITALAWFTARAQLRAYALVSTCKVQPPGGVRNTTAAELSITNFGKTPARDFTVSWTVNMAAGILDIPPEVRTGNTPPAVLAPGDMEQFDVPLLAYDTIPSATLHSTKALYEVKGKATYKDVFGREWQTDFNLYVYWTGSYMRVMRRPDGNGAT